MKFISEIDVMPLKALLDPQGKAVTMTLHNNGYAEIENVRIGKHITLEIEAASKDAAEIKVKEICAKLLHNPIMEGYQFTVNELQTHTG
jgi:phosphoribosylformylglycinamidine synthase